MSEQNVEIVRAAIEAVLRGPKPDYGAMNALFHPEHEFLSRIEIGLEGGSHRGAQGYCEWLTSASETFEWEGTLAEVTEIDHERVLAVTPTKFRGRHSGAETEQRWASSSRCATERWSALRSFSPLSRPLEAAGLRE